MKPTHAFVIGAVIAAAAVLGLSAATKTSQLGASARHTSVATVAARAHKLDAFEASLKKALHQQPPALPKVPVTRALRAGGNGASLVAVTATAPSSASAPRVIYRRPAPIIIHKHGHHGDDGYESEGGGFAMAAGTGSGHGGGDGGGND